jgi:hypothetical protein
MPGQDLRFLGKARQVPGLEASSTPGPRKVPADCILAGLEGVFKYQYAVWVTRHIKVRGGGNYFQQFVSVR